MKRLLSLAHDARHFASERGLMTARCHTRHALRAFFARHDILSARFRARYRLAAMRYLLLMRER